MSRAAIAVCVAAALAIAAWRLWHPPIDIRMKEELAAGRAYIRMCKFHEASDAYRRAAAMDETNPRALRGMWRAEMGISHFAKYRRHGKGCTVSTREPIR